VPYTDYCPECSPYPRHHRGARVQNQGDAPRRSKDALTNAQESLENAAVAVTQADERLIKELGKTASFETYVKLMLSRLRPVLIYFVHHGPERVRFILAWLGSLLTP
jgi:hypothetical protein